VAKQGDPVVAQIVASKYPDEPDPFDVEVMLRTHQEAHPTLGPLFKTLHAFADRTLEEFFWDTPDIPHPVIATEKDRGTRLGYYTSMDGYTLIHRVNLNVHALRNGAEAAETLAHELVHLWQDHVGRPCKRNYHAAEFHARMAEYGIETKGRRGEHHGYTTGRWQAWMEENSDLNLEQFILPGADATKPRKMLKQACPCGYSFRTRVPRACICLECEQPYEVV